MHIPCIRHLATHHNDCYNTYNQQFLQQMPHQYHGPVMRSLMQMMAPPFIHLPAYAVQTDLLSQICLRQQIKIVECKGEKSVEQHKKGSCSNCSARMRTSFGIRQSEKNSSPPHSFFSYIFVRSLGICFL